MPVNNFSAVATHTALTRTLHWLTVALVFFLIPSGIIMVSLASSPLQNQLFDLHRSVGVVVLAVAAMRIGNRLFISHAPAHKDLPALQRHAACTVHALLYALILALPVLGWLGASAYGATVSVFGLFSLPNLVAQDRALVEQILWFHTTGAFALIGLLSLHISAALYHHFVRRDGILASMWPTFQVARGEAKKSM